MGGAPERMYRRWEMVARDRGVCTRCRRAVEREHGLFGRRNPQCRCHTSPACWFAVEYPAMGYPFVRLYLGNETVGVTSISCPPTKSAEHPNLAAAMDTPGGEP